VYKTAAPIECPVKECVVNELEYLPLEDETTFKMTDPLVDRRWNIEQTIYENSPKCSSNLITYYIKSHYTQGYARRQKQRQSWGKHKNLVFVVFTKDVHFTKAPIDSNSGDMLKTSTFSETADLLAVKIALAVHHASQCDAHATFTDDDVYFFTDKFENMIRHEWSLKTTVGFRGRIKSGEAVVRELDSPWKKYIQTFEEYPYDKFPTYANGAGYVVSKLAIDRIIRVIPYTKVLRHLDDVYFGLLSRDAGIVAEYDDRFTNAVEPVSRDRKYPCEYYNLHGFDFDKINEFVTLSEKLCKHKLRFKIDEWRYYMDPENSMLKEIDSIYKN